MNSDILSCSDDDALVSQFTEWTSGSVKELRQLVNALEPDTNRGTDAVDRIYDLTHNIKGIGASFDYALLTAVGGALCGYLKDCDEDALISKRVLESHVRAFEVVLENKITGQGGEKGKALLQRLAEIIQEETPA